MSRTLAPPTRPDSSKSEERSKSLTDSLRKMIAICSSHKYCRDILGDYYGENRFLDRLYGHDSHFFEHRFWFKKEYYYCPGVVHKHNWEIVGPIYANNPWQHAMMVENCRCGVERIRELNREKI